MGQGRGLDGLSLLAAAVLLSLIGRRQEGLVNIASARRLVPSRLACGVLAALLWCAGASNRLQVILAILIIIAEDCCVTPTDQPSPVLILDACMSLYYCLIKYSCSCDCHEDGRSNE